MSVTVVLRCDLCQDLAANWLAPNATDAREAAANEGWKHVGRKDYCPECADSVDVRLHEMRLHSDREARRTPHLVTRRRRPR